MQEEQPKQQQKTFGRGVSKAKEAATKAEAVATFIANPVTKYIIIFLLIVAVSVILAACIKEVVLAATQSTNEDMQTLMPSVAKSSSSSSSSAASGTLEKALQIFEDLLNDDSHGYSQQQRNGPDFDCSSSILHSLQEAGFDTAGASYTGNMQNLCNAGWEQLPVSGVDGLQRGDICLNIADHVEWYLGNGSLGGFHWDNGHPETGDQGGEADAGAYYDFPWDCVLRYTGK